MDSDQTTSKSPHSLLWLAIVLVVTWIILRVALAVTSLALHILWIAAIVFAVMWVMRHLGGKRTT